MWHWCDVLRALMSLLHRVGSHAGLVSVPADGFHSVRRVSPVEGKSQSGAILRLPESHLQRGHRAVPLLHQVWGQEARERTENEHTTQRNAMHLKLSRCRSQLSQLVQSAVESNSLTIEPVAMSALPVVRASAVESGGPKWVIHFAQWLTVFTLFQSLLHNFENNSTRPLLGAGISLYHHQSVGDFYGGGLWS